MNKTNFFLLFLIVMGSLQGMNRRLKRKLTIFDVVAQNELGNCDQRRVKAQLEADWGEYAQKHEVKRYSTWDKPQELTGHTGWVSCLAALGDNKLASGSLDNLDNTVRICTPGTKGCLQELTGHTDGVSCLALMEDGSLASGSRDNTVRIWNPDTSECLQVLTGHTHWVFCLKVMGNKLVSGSKDNTVRIWNPDTGGCLHTLTGHTGWVSCLATVVGNKLASGSYDKTVRVWDLSTGECLRELTGHTGVVTCLAAVGNKIASGSGDKTVRIRDPNAVFEGDLGACADRLLRMSRYDKGLKVTNQMDRLKLTDE